jgi:hypothetical protein
MSRRPREKGSAQSPAAVRPRSSGCLAFPFCPARKLESKGWAAEKEGRLRAGAGADCFPLLSGEKEGKRRLGGRERREAMGRSSG